MVEVVCKNLKVWLANHRNQSGGYLHELLLCAPPKKVSRVACKVVLERILSEMPIAIVAQEIGERIEIAIAAQASKSPATYYRRLNRLVVSIGVKRARRAKLGMQNQWDRRIRISVGTVMLEKIREWTGMIHYVRNPEEPNYKRRKNLVAATPECLEWLRNSRESIEATRCEWQPSHEPFPEFKGDNEVASAVNRAQEIAWRLNRRVVEVIEYCFTNSVRAPQIPGGEKPETKGADMTKSQWAKLQTERFYWISGRRRTALYLAQARGLPEQIYYRWKHDFRGRLNCASKLLFPQGSDMGKAMLEFDRGIPIGDNAHYLARQGANCWGLSHSSYSVRVDWVNSNQRAITRCAKDPIGTLGWWSTAADPWKFLAFCFEWNDYLDKGPSFVTHQPCQIDGTCNGFQIVALLMRDSDLAATTNLIDADIPRDLYGLVAMDVEKALHRDDPWGWLALLGGKVDRSAVKGPTLSTGFGGNLWSASEATKRWFWVQGWDFPFRGKVNVPCTDFAKLVRNALGKHCPAYSTLHKWFVEITKQIDGGVTWRSPSGIVVTTKSMKQRLARSESGRTVDVWYETDEMDIARTRRSVLPNFIQSLDASCLSRTMNRCAFEVQPIHDCFGAHAPNMNALHQAVRASYSEVFSPDLLADLVDQLGIEIDPPSGMGVFEPADIESARYSFT